MSEKKKNRPVPVLHRIVPKRNRPKTNACTSNELIFFWDDLIPTATRFAVV